MHFIRQHLVVINDIRYIFCMTLQIVVFIYGDTMSSSRAFCLLFSIILKIFDEINNIIVDVCIGVTFVNLHHITFMNSGASQCIHTNMVSY